MPDAEYILPRSGLPSPPMLGRLRTLDAFTAEAFEGSPMLPLRTLSGKLSRLPPKIDEGAKARIDALVSREFLRRRFDEEARVRMEALSVRSEERRVGKECQ